MFLGLIFSRRHIDSIKCYILLVYYNEQEPPKSNQNQYRNNVIYNTNDNMPTATFLVIEKNGTVKEQSLKLPTLDDFDETILYKKAGFKSAEGFACHAEWNIDNLNDKQYTICVYGKTVGRANQENKFEFPPPIDNTLFFGNCIVLNKVDDEWGNLTQKEWDGIYDYLYGGFEDVGDDDESEEEEDEDDDLPRTKNGYVKDGFVVDDDEVEEDDEEEEEEEEEEEYVPKPKKARAAKSAPKKTTKAKASKKAPVTVFEPKDPENYLDCSSELSEEEYI